MLKETDLFYVGANKSSIIVDTDTTILFIYPNNLPRAYYLFIHDIAVSVLNIWNYFPIDYTVIL